MKNILKWSEKCKKAFYTVLVALCILTGMAVTNPMQAEAASTTSRTPISCYTINGKVTTYTTSSLSRVSGYIASGDLCKITATYSNGAVRVQYPVSGGYKTAYAPTGAFFRDANFSTSTRTLGRKLTAYRRPTGSSTIGTVYATDSVVITGNNGSRTQVIYPVSGGYKLGWVAGVYAASSPAPSPAPAPSRPAARPQTFAEKLAFHAVYYANRYGDLKAAYGYDETKLYQHWINYGIKEGRSGSPVFDAAYYLACNIDVAQAYGSRNYTVGYQHFITHGWKEGRSTSEYYWDSYYKSRHSDLSSMTSGQRMEHYLAYGIKEKRWANSSGKIPNIVKDGTSDATNPFLQVLVPDTPSNNNQRQSVADYMKQCATIRWTPKKTFLHWSGGRYWYAGTYYKGIPYSQKSRQTNLEKFKKNLSGSTYVGPAGQTTYLGSDCSSAVSMAYRTINAGFPITNTTGLYPKSSYMKAVGNYRHNNMTNATSICNLNGKSAMKNAYAQCQVGDLLLQNGHVMMVTGVYNGYVTATHQTTYSSSLKSTWRVDEKYTFDSLYSKKFIPVTMKAW